MAALATALLGLALFHAARGLGEGAPLASLEVSALAAHLTGAAPALAAAAAALTILALAAHVRGAWWGLAAAAAAFGAQLGWTAWIAPEPFGEFGALWDQARRLSASFAAGAPDWALLHASPAPSAAVVYALVMLVVGQDFAAVGAISAALWAVQTWLVWRIAREVVELAPYAFAAALVFGLSPGVVVFGGLPSEEAVAGAFALSSVYFLLSHRRRGLGWSAFLSGGTAAFAFLARPASLGFGAALLALMLFAALLARGLFRRLSMTGALLAFLAGAAAGLAPQAALNYAEGERFSVSPGPALGYQLLLGTNRQGGGGYDAEGLAAAGYVGPELLPMGEADAAARRIAFERVAADPVGFLEFAVTEKAARLWGSERELLNWSLNSPGAQSAATAEARAFAREIAPPIVDGVFFALLCAAFIGAARLTLRMGAVCDPARWVLIVGVLVLVAAVQLVLEARERHHLTMTPLLALLAVLAVARLPEIAFGARRAALEPAAAPALEPLAAAATQSAPELEIAAAQRAVSAETPGGSSTPAAETAEKPVEQRLATVLSRMSKPPRPSGADGAPASRDGLAPGPVAAQLAENRSRSA